MKNQVEKSRILEMAEDFRMVDECNDDVIEHPFYYIRKAINWKPEAEKRSNKLSECRGRYYENTNQDIMKANKNANYRRL